MPLEAKGTRNRNLSAGDLQIILANGNTFDVGASISCGKVDTIDLGLSIDLCRWDHISWDCRRRLGSVPLYGSLDRKLN